MMTVGEMVGILLALIVLAVVAWVLSLIPMDARARTALHIGLGIVFLLWLLRLLGLY